jgi:hypothetical protein
MSRVAGKVLLRWRSLVLSTAMGTWQAHAKEQKRLERAALKIVLRARNYVAGIAFSTWLQRAEESRRQAKEKELQGAMKALEDEKSGLVQKMQVHKKST